MINPDVPKETAVRIAIAHTDIAEKLISACCSDRLGIKSFINNKALEATRNVMDFVNKTKSEINYVIDDETTKEEENYYLTLDTYNEIDEEELAERIGKAVYRTWAFFFAWGRPETILEAIELMTRGIMFLTGGKPYEGIDIDYEQKYVLTLQDDIPAICTNTIRI